jgi:trans-2-enoyl-CoA reductase
MRQVVFTSASPDPALALDVVDADEPACPDDGVVVTVRARPINPADLLLLTGRHVYAPEPGTPVGIEGAGVITAAGPRSRHRVGTRVAIPAGGTWRERMALEDVGVIPIPDALDFEQAAMLSVNPFTAAGLLEGVPAGATVVVNAASSAVARLVFALARRRGVHTVGVARSPAAEAEVLARGAGAFAVDGPDLAARVRAVAPTPVARALDAVAGEASGRLLDALDDGGTLVVYGLLGSDVVTLPATRVVFRDVTVRGYSRLRALRALTAARRAELVEELVALVRDGTLRSEVEARFPLAAVREALARDARPDRRGKVILES